MKIVNKFSNLFRPKVGKGSPGEQDLELYWDPSMAEVLETWGQGNAWREIELLLAGCEGPVLDIACGTGKVMEMLSKSKRLVIYGCDISDFLIAKAVDRGISKDLLTVCDATRTGYNDGFFNHAYSIGSLEHFTEEGITGCLRECHRVTRKTSFHMVPVSRDNQDQGWIKTHQSYFNNSDQWWLSKFKSVYKGVVALDSVWSDDWSTGKWFVCFKTPKW